MKGAVQGAVQAQWAADRADVADGFIGDRVGLSPRRKHQSVQSAAP